MNESTAVDQPGGAGVLPRCVGVVGAGVMGSSIAHLTSSVGIATVIKVSARPGAAERARQAIQGSYAREVQAGRLTPADAEAGQALVRVTDDFAALGQLGCDLVIESVPEDLALKHEVLAEVEAVTGDRCIFASNTSSFPIGWLAERANRPSQVVGMHYFWPAHRQPLVEISILPETSPSVVERARALGRQQRRVELLVRDSPGFFTSRVLMPYLSEALLLLGQGASVDEVDTALEAFGWRMGPFRLFDAAGVEVIAHVYECLHPYLGERIAGLACLPALVREGLLGQRAGVGFYESGPEGRRPNRSVETLFQDRLGRNAPGEPDPNELVHRPVWMMLAEAERCVTEGVVARWEDADLGANLGLVFPKSQGGLLAYRNRVGEAAIRQQFATWEQRYGPRFCLD